MTGIIFSLLAGLFISLQNIFNTRVSDKIGLWETTVIVHIVGLVVALLIMFLWGDGNIKRIDAVNKLYLLGGAFGVIIIFSILKGFTLLNPSFSIAIILISQLIVGTIIETLGLFGTEQIKLSLSKPIGISIMIIGIIIFKLK